LNSFRVDGLKRTRGKASITNGKFFICWYLLIEYNFVDLQMFNLIETKTIFHFIS